MKLLENNLVLERLYEFCDLREKLKLMRATEDRPSVDTMLHRMKHVKLRYCCHICAFQLCLYYSSNCTRLVRFFEDGTQVFHYREVFILRRHFKNIS